MNDQRVLVLLDEFMSQIKQNTRIFDADFILYIHSFYRLNSLTKTGRSHGDIYGEA